jgi:LAO/AO transport system kinase
VTSPLADRVAAGDPLALARAISLVEDGLPEGEAVLAALFPRTGRARVIGVTGPPGAGKSTLVSRLVGRYRGAGGSVGVIAVDPSSAFSGGAILGDRIRMQEHVLDPGVFIRSMASRGQFGGLSRATRDAVDLLDASGRDPVLIETVGVGQDEVDVVRVADTVLVVLTPGQGDDIQAIKAGLLEIADIFVINKADHPGADRLASDLEGMLALGEPRAWRPPILETTAHEGGGVESLLAAIDAHGEHLDAGGGRAARRRAGLGARLLDILRDRVLARLLSEGLGRDELRVWEERLEARQIDPYGAARAVLDRGGVELDHVGVAVRRIDERLALWRDLLGLRLAGVEPVPAEGVRVAFLPAGRTRIELVEPADAASAMVRHIDRRGEGIHHLCLEVDDLDATVERLRAGGVRFAGEPGSAGAEGARVAFIHPKSSGGVLIELRTRGGHGQTPAMSGAGSRAPGRVEGDR